MAVVVKRGRKTPYTEIGVRRLKCYRCKRRRAVHQWNVCADGNIYRPICRACDISLNAMVLRWMRDGHAAAKMAAYAKSHLNQDRGAPVTKNKYIAKALAPILNQTADTATYFINEKLRVKATFQGKRRKNSPEGETIILTIGRPNYVERHHLKKRNKKQGLWVRGIL